MKRLFYFVCFAATVLAIVAGSFTAQIAVSSASAAALTPGNPLQAFEQAGSRPRDLRYIIANVVRVALGFVGMILLILTLYAGFLWFSARGNDDQVTQAKAILRNAVIGLIVITLSYSMTLFVFRSVFNPQQENPESLDEFLENTNINEGPGNTDVLSPYQYQRGRN
jgi:cytochrome bd-type quinol oxidase subunit 2